ncbi:MAG: chorismate mutase, partial [Bacteroidia bacterium]|nr:chorismate mutase [Bacteroidia bacterium]
SECSGMEEIRKEIDQIDQEIIRLFALRSNYVHEIVKFKTDEESVIAKERKELVIRQRAEWANATGLDKKTFEDIYSRLLEQNISEELLLLKTNK